VLITIVQEDDSVRGVELSGPDGAKLIVDCDACVMAQDKLLDADTFKAINESCIVFDGKIVVDTSFKTNDSLVYSAGPAAKYSRKYFAEASPLSSFNSKELGRLLADSLLCALDPLAPKAPPPETPLKCCQPKIVSAILPTGLAYLHVHGPRPIDSPLKNTKVLATTADSPTHLFELVLDEYGTVASLTCAVVGPILDATNLIKLFGLHEKYLNRLSSRFQEGLIKDFFGFFRDSWTVAIFHDRFHEFISNLYANVKDSSSIDLVNFESGVQELAKLSLESEGETDTQKRGELLSACRALVDVPATGRLIKDRLMDFLTYNSYLLPNYARPGMW